MRPSFAILAALLATTGFLPAGTTTYRNAVLADSPIAYWEMDEPAGTSAAADAAGTPQPGDYQNVTLGQASAFPNLGTCGQFNGTSSRIAVAASSVLAS